jgi:hypothetical protein
VGVSIRAFAESVGVSHTAVRKRIENGTLSTLEDGTIDPRVAVREWVMATRENPNPGTPGSTKATQGSAGHVGMLLEARAARQVIEAQIADLNLKKMRGELVNAEEMKKEAFSLARRIRDLLLSTPSRLAPVVAGLGGDTDGCYKAIESEMENVCDELAALAGEEE